MKREGRGEVPADGAHEPHGSRDPPARAEEVRRTPGC